MKVLNAGGLRLHYDESGVPIGPPLVFINSLGTDLRIWDEVVPHFSHDARIVRYDQRGHGLSDCAAGPYRLHAQTEDLTCLLDHLQIATAILIGISIGGLIAMDFALTQPERVSALVLCDTAPKIGTAEMWTARIETVKAQGLESVGDAILTRWFANEFVQLNPTAYRGYFNMLTRMPLPGYIAACEALREADLTNDVHQIKTQTLAVCGSQDISTPPSQMREWVSQLPKARLDVIVGSGHLPCIERPTELAALIRGFLREAGYGG